MKANNEYLKLKTEKLKLENKNENCGEAIK